MKKSRAVKLLIVLIVAGGTWYGWRTMRSSKNKSAGASSAGKVERGDLLQRISFGGTVFPVRSTTIVPPYAGYIRKIFVSLGDQVKENDALVSITQSLDSQEAVYPIRSPFKGTIVQLERREGEFVRDLIAGVIMRVDDLSRLKVIASVPEVDILKVKIGQKANVKVSAITERSYEAIVREISLASTVDYERGRAEQNFKVELELEKPDQRVRPGMSTVVDVTVDEVKDVLSLRHEFIQPGSKEGEFFVTKQDGSKQPVTLGLQNEERAEIKSGLSEGDLIKPVDFLAIKEREKEGRRP